MAQVQGTLTAVPPFDFKQSLRFLGQFRPAMGEQSTDNGILTKAVSLEGCPLVYRVCSTDSIEQPQLTYTLHSENDLTPEFQNMVAERLAFFLSLNDDLRPFYAIAENDPQFAPVIKTLYGYHQVKFSMSAFENACWSILSQRNLMTVSRKMKEGLTERFGEQIVVDGVTYRAFPEAFPLAVVSPDDINSVVKNQWKSQGISNVARAFAHIDEAWLREASYAEVEKWLLAIKGIGAWSASFILLRSLGHMERLPVDEKWLREAANRVYGRFDMTTDDLKVLAKPYGDYAGYWAHYLRAAAS